LSADKPATGNPCRGCEPLEPRQLLSVSLDANGWTVVTPSADTRMVYVSTSGSDSNDGLSPNTPVQTLAKAQSLVRSGFPDWLLLKRGDVFNDFFTNWNKSGRSTQEPMLISAYGTGARPQIDSGSHFGAFATNDLSTVNYLDMIGLALIANNHDPNSPTYSFSSSGSTTGYEFKATGGNLLVEDCMVRFYRDDFDIEAANGPLVNVTLRRNVICDSWSNAASLHSEGVYSHAVAGFTVTENVFDHNGWNEQIPGATQQGYNHDMYFSYAVTGADIEGNIFSNASFAGINLRCGGIVRNNLFANDAIALNYGNADGANSTAGGVTGDITNNVVDGDKGLGTGAYGEGFAIGNIKPGAGLVVQGNILAHDTQNARQAILLTMATGTLTPDVAVGENDLTIQNNIIYQWNRAIEEDGRFVPGGTGLYAFNNVTIQNNDLIGSPNRLVRHDGRYAKSQEHWNNNRYYTGALTQANWFLLINNTTSWKQWHTSIDHTGTALSAAPYADPTRSTATYDATLGGPGTLTDFLAQARLLSHDSYRPQYMAQAVIDYIKKGFTLDTTAPTAAVSAMPNVGVAMAGASSYTFTVTFTDDFFLNRTSLDSNDLLVTGPNGYSQPATFLVMTPVSVSAGGYQSTGAVYQVTAPNGAWSAAANGTYTVSIRPNQVRDTSGNYMAAGVIGTFQVDLSPPTAAANAAPIGDESLGLSSYSFTVTFSDNSAIDTTTLGNTDLEVTGPNGYDQLATLVGVTGSGGLVTATYSIPAPGGSWSSAANGSYVINVAANQVADTFGNFLASGPLATFYVDLSGGGTGNPPPASGAISGFAFNDANGNGVMDPQELPMVGLLVYIDSNLNGQFDPGELSTATDDNGQYSFTGLSDGTYIVREQTPSGYKLTTPAAQQITIINGQAITDVDFGNRLSTIIFNGTIPSGGGGSGIQMLDNPDSTRTVPLITLLA
jgi:hypothetical protein